MFEKGKSGNPEGRKKGTPNKVTGELRQVISDTLTKELTEKKLRAMLKGMKDREKLDFMIRLIDFVLPRLKQQDISLDFENMSDGTIDALISRLFENNSGTGE